MLGVVMMRLRAARGATNPTRCAFELAPPRLCWTIDSHPQNLVHPIRREPLLASFHCAAGRVFRRYLLYSHTSAGFYNSPAKSLRPRLTKNSSRCILSPPEPAELPRALPVLPRVLSSRETSTPSFPTEQPPNMAPSQITYAPSLEKLLKSLKSQPLEASVEALVLCAIPQAVIKIRHH